MVALGLWLSAQPLLLASTSRIRRELLESAGLPVETIDPGIDEREVARGLGRVPPAALASHLAEAKALAVSHRESGRIVVGADQVLDLDGAVLTKARDRDEAAGVLERLSGRSHVLVSAAVVARGGEVVWSGSDAATVTLRPLDDARIALYLSIAGEAVTRSVGCYEAEGLGRHLFERVEGDHSTVLGLPMLPLLAALRQLGCLAL